MREKPFIFSYEIAPNLWGGEYPGDLDSTRAREKVAEILAFGVTDFIDLTEEGELLPYAVLLEGKAKHHRFPIPDVSVPDSPATMREILEAIDESLKRGGVVYLHCWGGIGRTGVVGACHLAAAGGLTGEEALRQLKERFRANPKSQHWDTPQTEEQETFVLEYARWNRIRGCLLGGAVGDALGAPVEFHSLYDIRQEHGPAGVTGYVEFGDGTGAITDDTQMTLFTAEGLLRARVRNFARGICHPPSVVHRAYLRWLDTQGEASGLSANELHSGWLIEERALHHRRAPGNSCLSALLEKQRRDISLPINNSKGCGGVMRSAPAGMIGAHDSFKLGCEISALTHGHPTGFLAGGALSLLIERLLEGDSLPEAAAACLERLRRKPCHEELTTALEQAIEFAATRPAVAETVEELGEGWIAEEALAIALFCALKHPDDFRAGVLLAVNISGDSDSTGAITGNLLGAMLGERAIPREWLTGLREREIVEAIADDLATGIKREKVPPELARLPGAPQEEVTRTWWNRYPGY